jgi:Kelch motif
MSELPDQVLRYILSFLDGLALSTVCSRVSRRFRRQSTNAANMVIGILSEKYPWVSCSLREAADRKFSAIQTLHILTSPQIILVGGNTEPRRVDSYDVRLRRWFDLADTNVGHEVFFEVLFLRGYVYVFCGIHHASYGMVERYNPVMDTWEELKSLPGKLAAVVGSILNDKIYITGGYDWHLAEYSDAVFVYDEVKNDWQVLDCRLRIGRSSHACIAFKGKLWVAGGIVDGQESEGNATVEVYDPEVGYWVDGPHFTVRRFRLRLFIVCGELYAVGGDRDERGRFTPGIQTIEKLDEDQRSWKYVTTFKVERRGFLSSVVGSRIYIIGGRTGDVPLNNWDCYDVLTGEWLSEVLEKRASMDGEKQSNGGHSEGETEIEDEDSTMQVVPSVISSSSEEDTAGMRGAAVDVNSMWKGYMFGPGGGFESELSDLSLNRIGGIVGGRAVTVPDIELTW